VWLNPALLTLLKRLLRILSIPWLLLWNAQRLVVADLRPSIGCVVLSASSPILPSLFKLFSVLLLALPSLRDSVRDSPSHNLLLRLVSYQALFR
jgi:hypothetical protein